MGESKRPLRDICLLLFKVTILGIALGSVAVQAGMVGQDCSKAWEKYRLALALSNDSEEEALFCKQALELCPELIEARITLGEILLHQSKYDEAITEFLKAKLQILSSDKLMSRPGSKKLLLKAMSGIAEAYKLQGRLAMAEEQYRAILAMFPDYATAQNRLKYVYKRENKFKQVLSPYYRLLTNPTFTRVSAFPLPKGKFLFDTQFRYWHQTAPLKRDMFDADIPLYYGPDERDVNVKLLIMGFRYGVTDKFSVGLIGRYFWKDATIDLEKILGPGKKGHMSVSGFGDTIFFMKYHVWGRRKTHLSIYHLLSIPTGDQNAIGTDSKVWDRGKMWHRMPLGSGSFDFIPGLAFTTDLDPVITNLNITYRITNGQYVGDEFNISVAFMYPYKHAVYANLEFNYRWRDEVRRKQHIVAMLGRPDYYSPFNIPAGPVEMDTWLTDKGGSSFFVMPGLEFFVSKRVKLEIGAKVPVIKEGGGWTEDYVIHGGLSLIFF